MTEIGFSKQQQIRKEQTQETTEQQITEEEAKKKKRDDEKRRRDNEEAELLKFLQTTPSILSARGAKYIPPPPPPVIVSQRPQILKANAEKCDPRKCHLECMKNCPVNARHALVPQSTAGPCLTLGLDGKIAICLERCRGLTKCACCVKRCPLGALSF